MEDNVVTVDGPSLQERVYDIVDSIQENLETYEEFDGGTVAIVLRDALIDTLEEFE